MATETELGSIMVPSAEQFAGIDFLPDANLDHLTAYVVKKHAPRFDYLADLEFETVWKAKGGKRNGNLTLGACVKLSGLAKHFGRVDYVIWLAADHAGLLQLTPDQLEALVFHELCHTGVDEDGDPQLVGHDFEGFRAEIEAYGWWEEGLRLMRDSVQRRMFEDDDPTPAVDRETGEIR